jgi:hypothetical protein
MMRALVVYESMFGNTRDVALAIADGIGAHMDVEVIEVGVAPTILPTDIALVAVGGPTHAHGLTSPKSRADAAQRAGDALVSRGNGIAEWLDGLRPGAATVAAAFDTRIKGPGLLWGSAAKGAAKRLRASGFRLAADPESFLVDGPTGPLVNRLLAGEAERARAWGAALASRVAGPVLSR